MSNAPRFLDYGPMLRDLERRRRRADRIFAVLIALISALMFYVINIY